jgi:hypothetical protein
MRSNFVRSRVQPMIVALGGTLLVGSGAPLAGSALFAGSAWAQDYPSRPINMGLADRLQRDADRAAGRAGDRGEAECVG